MSLYAISVDSPDENREHCKKEGYTFAFLSDPNAEVIRRYGVVHPAGQNSFGKDIARPAEFLVDPQGVIRWVNFTEDYRIRARADAILRAVDEMAARPGG